VMATQEVQQLQRFQASTYKNGAHVAQP
jgi:hypothetical protein